MTAPKMTGTDEDLKNLLKKRFPRWSIIKTKDTGRWWATCGPLTREDLDRTSDVSADTPAELYLKLEELDQPNR